MAAATYNRHGRHRPGPGASRHPGRRSRHPLQQRRVVPAAPARARRADRPALAGERDRWLRRPRRSGRTGSGASTTWPPRSSASGRRSPSPTAPPGPGTSPSTACPSPPVTASWCPSPVRQQRHRHAPGGAPAPGATIEVIPDDEHGRVDVEALVGLLDRRSQARDGRARADGQPREPRGRGGCGPAGDSDTLFLLDACQSVGQLPVDVAAIGCDVLCATGLGFLRRPRGTASSGSPTGLATASRPPGARPLQQPGRTRRRLRIASRRPPPRALGTGLAAKLGLVAALDYPHLDIRLGPSGRVVGQPPSSAPGCTASRCTISAGGGAASSPSPSRLEPHPTSARRCAGARSTRRSRP